MAASEAGYEFFAEWKVRRIPMPSKEPQETYAPRLKDWVLSSIGIEGTAKDLFLYIEDSNVATIEELARHIGAEPELILQHVDLLYSIGLIHRVGKAYFVGEPISTSIVRRLIPRITESLRSIAQMESRSRSDASYYYKMRGRAFSEVGSAIAACKDISHAGGSPIARVVGIHSFNNESVEVEGPVSNYGYSPQHLVVITESGEKVVVGNRNSRGADVQAHSVIIRGEKNE